MEVDSNTREVLVDTECCSFPRTQTIQIVNWNRVSKRKNISWHNQLLGPKCCRVWVVIMISKQKLIPMPSTSLRGYQSKYRLKRTLHIAKKKTYLVTGNHHSLCQNQSGRSIQDEKSNLYKLNRCWIPYLTFLAERGQKKSYPAQTESRKTKTKWSLANESTHL